MRIALSLLGYCWVVATCLAHSAWAQDGVQPKYTQIRTIAGNGQSGAASPSGLATQVAISNPFGIQPEADGSLIIAGFEQNVLYRLDPDYRHIELIAGTGQAGSAGSSGDAPTEVAMDQPHEIQIDGKGNIYVTDTRNHRIGMIEADSGTWQLVAGTAQAGFAGDGGPAKQALLNQPYSLAIDGQQLFVADLLNQRVREINLSDGTIRTICGTGERRPPQDGGLAIEQPLAGPRSLAVDSQNVWIVLREGNSVWRIDRRDGRIHHVAGTGQKGFAGDGGDARQALLNGPKGIAVDPGVAIFIADTENHAIRQVDLASGQISTLVGSPQGQAGFNGDGGQLQQRLLSRPHGICLLKNGHLLIGDSENHRVRLVTEK